MRKFLFIVLSTLIPWCAATAQQPERVSVLDIAVDYGVPAAYLKDTNVFISYISNQSADYVAKASTCASLSARAQTMLMSLRGDFPHRDGLVLIDRNRAVTDFADYEPRLQQLSIVASRYSQHYLDLEQTRQKVSASQALSLEEADRQKLQENLNQQAQDLKDSIDQLNDSIAAVCLRDGGDKASSKERRDIYYAYTAIYNRVSTLPAKCTEATLGELNELIWMQHDLLTNVVSDSGYSQQIAAFPQRLKNAAESNASDIYRSYTRHFTHTAVAVHFNSIDGYRRYTAQMQDIVTTQNNYLRAIYMRQAINRNTDTILSLYTRPYGEIADAYRRHLATLNTTPAFNRIDESQDFMASLEEFIQIQNLYISNYYRLEAMRQRGRDIVDNCPKNCADLRTAYLTLPKVESLVPNFRTLQQYEDYEQQMQHFERVQHDFERIIVLRDSIDRTEQRLTTSADAEKVFVRGYQTIKQNASFSADLEDAEQTGESLRLLEDFITTQQLCEKVLQRCHAANANDATIAEKGKDYPNILKAYQVLRKDYNNNEAITDMATLQNYHIRKIELCDVQERFLALLRADNATDINLKMRGLRDLKQIKSLFHL